MADINWEPYISTRARNATQTIPQVTITNNSGRISLNSAACELVLILSRLVDTFSSRFLYPMLLLSGNYSIAVV